MLVVLVENMSGLAGFWCLCVVDCLVCGHCAAPLISSFRTLYFIVRLLSLKESGKALSCYCASLARVLFDIIHVWAESLDSRVVLLPDPVVPVGWG